jgi:hypothetical protein
MFPCSTAPPPACYSRRICTGLQAMYSGARTAPVHLTTQRPTAQKPGPMRK